MDLNDFSAPILFDDETRGSHHGQTDAVLRAIRDGRDIGRIEYCLFGGKVHIQMIEVPETSRGQGVARSLIFRLQSQNPDKEIEWGTMTPEGAAFYRSLPKIEIPNNAVAAVERKLHSLRSKIEKYEQIQAEFELDKTEENRRRLLACDDWNECHDQIRKLEHYLQNNKPFKTIILYK